MGVRRKNLGEEEANIFLLASFRLRAWKQIFQILGTL